MPNAPAQRGRREQIAQGVMAFAVIIGAIGGAAFAMGEDLGVRIPPGLAAFGLLIAAIILSAVSVIYWRNLDEAAREAHKFAWFWGGSASLVIILPILPLLNTRQLVAVFGPHPPGDWVMGGVLSFLGLQIVCYSLTWAGWWLLRQR